MALCVSGETLPIELLLVASPATPEISTPAPALPMPETIGVESRNVGLRYPR